MSAANLNFLSAMKPRSMLLLLVALISVGYSPVLFDLLSLWWSSPEYSFGLAIPPIIAYLVYAQRDTLEASSSKPSLIGLFLFIGAQMLLLVAVLADIEVAKRYAYVGSLLAAIVFVGGIKLAKRFSVCFILLFLSIPFPYLLNAIVTAKMQLISSNLGVEILRLFGFAVYQDGNIISLGGLRMLVAEACSGLRYLYPLLAISLILASSFRGPMWIRVLLFLCAIPVTILMNSLRIAITGVLLKFYGEELALGFLHDFEGWFIFIAAFAFLILISIAFALLANFLTDSELSIAKRFNLAAAPKINVTQPRVERPSYYGYSFIAVAVISFVFIYTVGTGVENTALTRKPFDKFPFTLDGKEIHPQMLSPEIVDVLKADDYLLADYKDVSNNQVNLYMAYYAKQGEGSALHSPRVCLPGGGWNINGIRKVAMSKFGGNGEANRVLIEQGHEKMIVYYWIHQQGRNYANEFIARAMLMKEALISGRSDGALVRVIAPVFLNDIEYSEQKLETFIRELLIVLPEYLPQQ